MADIRLVLWNMLYGTPVGVWMGFLTYFIQLAGIVLEIRTCV